MTPPDFAKPQHQAAMIVAEALEAEVMVPRFTKVSLYQGETFSLIYAYVDTADGFDRLRIEVHPEKI